MTHELRRDAVSVHNLVGPDTVKRSLRAARITRGFRTHIIRHRERYHDVTDCTDPVPHLRQGACQPPSWAEEDADVKIHVRRLRPWTPWRRYHWHPTRSKRCVRGRMSTRTRVLRPGSLMPANRTKGRYNCFEGGISFALARTHRSNNSGRSVPVVF